MNTLISSTIGDVGVSLPSSGVRILDEILGGKGYPENSSILLIGPPGIGKEALGYLFAQDGVSKGELCAYVSRLPASEVARDMKAFGVSYQSASLNWLTSQGSHRAFDLRNPATLQDAIGAILDGTKGARIRIVMDVLSPLLVLNSSDTVYALLNRLLEEARQHNATLVATLEEGMQSPQSVVAMQDVFDGFIEMRLYSVGPSLVPLLRVGKMRGLTPEQRYFRFNLFHGEVTLQSAESGWGSKTETRESPAGKMKEPIAEPASGSESSTVFDYLVSAFKDDYSSNRLPLEQAGWRSRGLIIQSTRVGSMSLYGRQGQYGPAMRELMSKDLIETRFFPGERGRGGEIVKLRIAYQKAFVKALMDRASNKENREL